MKLQLIIINFITLSVLVSCQKTRDVSDDNIREVIGSSEARRWELSSYNFGGMEDMGVDEQVTLLRSAGYDGIILRVATDRNFEMLPKFLSAADQHDDFRVHAAFVRYNFDDEKKKERWSEVVDEIANRNIQLWVIFGKPVDGYGDDFIAKKLKEITEYAALKQVQVILYPHSSTYFESIEEGWSFVKDYDKGELGIAFHLYHEVRAGNGHRIHEVISLSKSHLKAVTLAGSDSVADYTNAHTRDTSTIKPIGKGSFYLPGLLKDLSEAEYNDFIGVMNFSIKKDPEVYLPESKDLLDEYMSELDTYD